ncbi:MAG: M14 family metallopeptidase [Polaromonas sp.]
MPTHPPPTRISSSFFSACARRVGVVGTLALLTACGTSVQLPPWTPGILRPAASTPAAVPAPVAPGPTVGAQTSPVLAPTVIASPVTAEAERFSAAVNARFAAPAVRYTTPGLQDGRTNFTTQDELQSWLQDQALALARSAGIRAAVLTIGTSQQGQPLLALVLTRGAGTDPAALEATGRPTVLLMGQQHGDEPASSEALLVIARELAQGLLQPLLERINVVIVPRANPDAAAGGEHLVPGAPDMETDHLLLDTPEAQALARLTRDYHPTVVVDAHEYPGNGLYLKKFGAVQKFDVQLQYAMTANLPEFLTKADEEWYRRPLLAALKGQGLSAEWLYTTSADVADKKISMGSPQPESRRNVDGLKNAVSLQIESRGAGLGRQHIQRRVHAQVTAFTSVLGSTAQRASELGQLRPYLDKEISAKACRGNALVQAAPTPAQYDLLMLDPATGNDKIVIVDWDSTLALQPVKSRVRPCGYWVSAESTEAIERLRLQGVKVQKVLEQSALLGDSYREVSRVATPALNGNFSNAVAAPIKVDVSLVRGVIDAAAGSYYVPLNQPLANLAMAALEPDTSSSYFANHLLQGLNATARVMSEPAIATEDMP